MTGRGAERQKDPLRSKVVLITRFAVRLLHVPPEVAARQPCLEDRWLQGRAALVERFCRPSVLGQTHSDYSWLLLAAERVGLSCSAWLSDQERDGLRVAWVFADTVAKAMPRDGSSRARLRAVGDRTFGGPQRRLRAFSLPESVSR